MNIEEILRFSVAGFTVERLLRALLIVVIGYFAVRYLMKLIGRAIGRTSLPKTLHDFMKSCIRLVLWFVVALGVCDALGIPVSSLLTLFGVVGLAVSLAIQGSLSNLASGVLLLITRPFSVGDFIESGAVSGTVVSLGLIHTRVTTPDNKVVFVPNGQLSSGQITNYTLMPTRRVDVPVTAPYAADAELVKSLLLEAAAEVPEIHDEPAPVAVITAANRNAVDYALRAWTATADYWSAHGALQERVKARLEAAGVERPADILDVRVRRQDEE